MSIRTNPMKAVPVLLKRVKTARSKFHESRRDESLDGKLEKLTRELKKIEDVFMRVKKNQDELVDTLHEVDDHLRKLDRKRLDQDMDHFCKRIRDCAHKLLPMEAFEDDHNTEIVQSSAHDPSSSQHKKKEKELVRYKHADLTMDMLHRLERPLSYCLSTLSIFPKEAIIDKRHIIYLWIGDGELRSTAEKTVEEVGEDMIDELLILNMIIPYGNGKCPLFNKFKLNPHVRSKLVQYTKFKLNPPLVQYFPRKQYLHHLGYYNEFHKSPWFILTQQKVTLGDGLKLDNSTRIVFNVGVRYLNFGYKWLERDSLEVLQLGRWQDSPSHHIEVGSQEFLKDLRNQKGLRYLSLRGISRISELPPSIVQLESLQILDLKACHNLETMPDDISSMKSLTHLILSKCYLLDGMPKGIEKLTQLQVLKGFVLGIPSRTPCRISDLANLKRLKRLSIHIGNGAVIEDEEFESLQQLSALKHLKISWGVSRYSDIPIKLPLSLEKLHLECFPGQILPDSLVLMLNIWEFPVLKELNITGGKLESMNIESCSVEIVRLKYLKHLQVDFTILKKLFPNVSYVEIKKIPNVSYFEGGRGWEEM